MKPELAESFAESVRADRAAGLTAGEQPGRGAWSAEGGLAATTRDDSEGERGEGLGQRDGLIAETDLDLGLRGSACGAYAAAGPRVAGHDRADHDHLEDDVCGPVRQAHQQ